jgi:hypothetical protein
MNGELKAKWLEALRSGWYKQGQGRLRDENNQFCCLGVLCDVGGLGTWRMDHGGYSYEVNGCKSSFLLPAQDATIARHTGDLMMLNDGYRLSFKEIADWIEENIEDN